MYYTSNKFEEAFRDGEKVEVLLETLDRTIVKIGTAVYRRFRPHDASVSKEDIFQEVRMYLWKKLPKLIKKEHLSSRELFKYCTTLIKGETIRAISEVKYVNPRLRCKRKAKESFTSLSRIDLEFFDYKAGYPIENLVATFKERCKDIPGASILFEFLTSNTIEEEYAGIGPNTYFVVLSEMKQLAKTIAEEIPYD